MGRKVATQRDISMQSLKNLKRKPQPRHRLGQKIKNLGKLKVRVNHLWRTDLSEVTNVVWPAGSVVGRELLM